MIFMPSRTLFSFSVRIADVMRKNTTMRGRTKNVAMLPLRTSEMVSSVYAFSFSGETETLMAAALFEESTWRIALSKIYKH